MRYIAQVSGGAEPALRLLDQIDEAAGLLASFPKTGSVPAWGTLAKRGYRELAVGSYILLYKVDDAAQTVTVYAFVRSRQEYWKVV